MAEPVVNPTKRSGRRKGRPQKSDQNKRNIKLQVYLSATEEQRLRSILSASGYSGLSPFVREVVLSGKKSASVVDKDLIRELSLLSKELNAVGKNVNQIAHVLNQAAQGEPIRADSFAKFASDNMNKSLELIGRISDSVLDMNRKLK